MELNVNKKYKNSMFTALFSEPAALRELYSAIEGVDIPEDAVVNINTLTEAIFMNKLNDISFTINDRVVVLIEHQSTINDNMPIRFLMYIGRVYEKITENEDIYRRKRIKIPAPEFIVLYNGRKRYPDYKELRLSAAFHDKTDENTLKSGVFPLELIVKIYNINYGRNKKILNKCKTLNGYSIFIDKVNNYTKIKTLEESIKDAVKYCLENKVLEKFLKENSSEVINMLFTEWNLDDAMAIAREEGYEDGVEYGIKKDKIFVAKKMLAHGCSPEFVRDTTGLHLRTVKSLNSSKKYKNF